MWCEYIADSLNKYNLDQQKKNYLSGLKIKQYQMKTTSMHKEYTRHKTWKV